MSSLNPLSLVWEILVTLALLGIFTLLFSTIIGLDSLQNYLRQNSANGKMFVALLGIVLSGCSFIISTGFVSRTSESNPPHGARISMWDVNPEVEQFGGVAFVYGNDYLPLNLGDSSLKLINNERFQRYLHPPFLRNRCYTENKIACAWVNIDIANFSKPLQWLDYLIRVAMGILSGLIGSEIMLSQMKKKNFLQMQEVG